MVALLASAVDAMHALLMVLWVVGMPLLFWHRWPRVTRVYGVFAIGFIIVNVLSQWLLNECVLTTLARFLWQHSSGAPAAHVDEWFTVRFSELVFHMTPSHASVKVATEILIFVSAVGTLHSGRKLRSETSDGAHVRRRPRHST